ncbi:DinB family protein [Paenibacillus sp. NPDC056933]|uniref:DinB family protein n=1 Tax=Paenibacillus sp. NPDC056933 TaxID=3345968 RepID=UPI00363E693B
MFTRNDDIRSQIWEAVSGLNEEQLNLNPTPERWSIMQVLRHLNLMESLIVKQCRTALEKEQTVSVDKKPSLPWIAATLSAPPLISSHLPNRKHWHMFAKIWKNLIKH